LSSELGFYAVAPPSGLGPAKYEIRDTKHEIRATYLVLSAELGLHAVVGLRLTIGLHNTQYEIRDTSDESRSNCVGEFFAVIIKPFGFTPNHLQEVQAAQVAEKAGCCHRQNRLSYHRLDHQIEQRKKLAPLQPAVFNIVS
jgi:hypothetical protein